MNNKLYHGDLAHYSEGDFRISSDLEVYFGKEQIGCVRIIEHPHPEGDDEIACFFPGMINFQHYPVWDAGSACVTIHEKYYERKKRRK